ncbi:MAG TPA: outer membrane beta-barrel protein [Bryobacteraceae bacterium]|nr:outer membrane beta-barrel protein [Bryobacteraceae bacterium]
MRLRYVYPALFLAAIFAIPPARAQSSFDLNVGFGSAWNKSNGQGFDSAQSINAFGPCTPNSADPFCLKTPSLGGFFLGFGGDVMLTKRYGFGAEVSFQPGHPDYGPFQYRQTFYDFNGIYSPVNNKRVQVKIEGGIGGARTSFAVNQTSCIGAACATQAVPTGINANHFAIHVGVGVELFVTEHFFVRPEFDYRYVNGFTDQFNSTSVPAAMVWVGYSFGEH